MEETIASKPRVCFEFEVEKVIGVSNDGNYQVQWAPAWVSKFHLVGCEHLIEEFLQQEVDKVIKTESETQCEASDVTGEVIDSWCQGQPDSTQAQLQETTLLQQPVCKIEIADEMDYTEASSSTNEDHLVTDDRNDASDMNGTVSLLEESTSNDRAIVYHSNQTQSPKPQLNVQEMHLEGQQSSHFWEEDSSYENGPVVTRTGFLSTSVNQLPELRLQPPHLHPLNDKQTDTSKQTSDEYSVGYHGKRHLARKDSNDKRLECGYCSKKFKLSGDLNRHIRIHTGEKPYHCDYCDYSSAQKGNLVKHMRCHADKQPLICDNCENSFVLKIDLRSHLCTPAQGSSKGKILDKLSNTNYHAKECSSITEIEISDDEEN